MRDKKTGIYVTGAKVRVRRWVNIRRDLTGWWANFQPAFTVVALTANRARYLASDSARHKGFDAEFFDAN